jgi:hypothetical protein
MICHILVGNKNAFKENDTLPNLSVQPTDDINLPYKHLLQHSVLLDGGLELLCFWYRIYLVYLNPQVPLR